MNRIYVAGVCGPNLDPGVESLLDDCVAVVAGRRHCPLVEGRPLEIVPVSPLEAMAASLEAALDRGSVMVLASGDPLFFGIGRRLVDLFGPERISFFPALSSVQLAASRFGIPWDDMMFVSLHGRDVTGYVQCIASSQKSFVLTDCKNSPDRVARRLFSFLDRNGLGDVASGICVHVAENLALPDERLFSGGLEEVAAMDFSPLNVMIVESPWKDGGALPVFGLKSSGFACVNGMVTKDETRAVAIHKLSLPARGVMWDAGSGSGSVAIESARIAPALSVYAVERDPVAAANIRKNLAACSVFNVDVVEGLAPDVFADLPDPDRVFVGGSGGRLREILAASALRLRKNGIVVVNAVLEETAAIAPDVMRAAGLRVEISRLSVERITVDNGREITRLNPITVIKGVL